jgi:WD40 repeat protein
MPLQFHGKYLLTSPTYEDTITCVAFSVHGDYIAVGGLNQRLHIFSLANGQLHYSIIFPSPIKSLIWLPGAEQTLVCACHSGILMNIIVHPGVSKPPLAWWDPYTLDTKDTMNLNCFRAQHHTVEFMAADASISYLATGSGLDVRVWKGDKCSTSLRLSLHLSLFLNIYFR